VRGLRILRRSWPLTLTLSPALRGEGILVALALLAATLTGCPKDEPKFDDTDPLIKKLKAEQQRLGQGAPPGGPPQVAPQPNPLAAAAVDSEGPETREPVSTAAVHADNLSVSVATLEAMHNVRSPKLSISTADLFVKVSLSATASVPTTLDLAKAELVNGDDRFEVARDAQKLGQGSPLSAPLEPGITQTLVVYFEAPRGALKKGLKLILPSPQGAVELPLR